MSFISAPSAFRNAASWSALPLATTVPPGSVYRVEGFGAMGFSFWVSDGLVWRPFNGYIRAFADMTADTGSPLATVTAAATKFALPDGDLLIPAGMLQDGFMVDLRAWLTRSLTGGVTNPRATLNTTNGITLATFCEFQINAANSECRMASSMTFGGNASQAVREGSFTGWNAATTSGSVANQSIGINTALDMYVVLGSGGTFNEGDTLNLMGYEIIVRG